MSNVMAANSNGAQTGPLLEAPLPQTNSVDWFKLLWRWKWLTLLGCALGALIGFLILSRQPAQYTAVATIQVVYPQSDLLPLWSPQSGFAGGVKNRADEARVITSKSVLLEAINKGDLKRNAAFIGKSDVEIIDYIRSGQRLVVTPGTKENTTEILDVAFTCNDQNLAAEVVKAIVAGYDSFISKETQSFGKDVIDQVERARNELDGRMKVLNSDYLKFRRTSDLIFIGNNEGRDPYAEIFLSFNNQLHTNRMRVTRLESALQQVKEGLEQKRNPESLLLMLQRAAFDNRYDYRTDNLKTAVTMQNMRPLNSQAEAFRRQELIPLQMKEQSLLAAGIGESHNSVRDIRLKIAMAEELLAELEEMERSRQAELMNLVQEQDKLVMSPEDRLKLMIESVQEELVSLQLEGAKLEAYAKENREKSREQQAALAENRIWEQNIATVGSFLDSLNTAVNKLNLAPEYGSKTMHRLEMPEIGVKTGPFALAYILLGAFVGSALFFGLSYILEVADRSFRSPDEITTDLGLPIFGHIPMAEVRPSDRKDEKVDLSVVTVHRGKSTQSESFRGVRTAIYFSNRAGNIKVVQVTSPVPGDGKSTLAANVAVTMAQSGRKVLLMDADFRRPRIAKLFGVREEIGLTSVISGKAELIDAIQPSTIENLSILASGKRPSNPAELLSSSRFEDLLDLLREKFDFVVIDTPPLLAVSDPANVAANVDGVLLCLRLRRNLKPLAHRATQMLHSINANVLGVVVNGVGGRGGYGYGGYRYGAGYGYGYGYRYGYGYGYGYGSSGAGYGYGYGSNYGYGAEYGANVYLDDDKSGGQRKKRRSETAQPSSE